MQLLKKSPAGRRFQLLSALVIVASFALVLVVPPFVPPASSASCPPGWESCTAWAPNGQCCQPIGFLWRVLEKTCTVWDHDINAYPTCTYKVVDRYTVKTCDWWDAC